MATCTPPQGVDSLTSSISVKNDRNRSTFSATRADLDGLYLCEASNKFGRASGSLFIHRILTEGSMEYLLQLLVFCWWSSLLLYSMS
ncbi:nectin-4-like [Arapaima gigas]